MVKPIYGEWQKLDRLPAKTFYCGYCGTYTSSKEGYSAQIGNSIQARIYICSGCNYPILDFGGRNFPESAPGHSITKAPDDITQLYEEARLSTAAGAFTSAVLVCRKILMHVGVEKGAVKNESFLKYVEFLSDKGYLPPDGKSWVDYIRSRGNEANHEILLMKKEDAVALIDFTEMLLRFIYEFPHKVPSSLPPPPSTGGGAPGGGRP